MKKLLGIGIIIVLIGAGVASGLNIQIKDSEKNVIGNILYVGGSGPNNYTTIQSAIDDASFGDTVFVYDDSAPYYENVVVDKSIRLFGENRDTTIIDGNLDGSAIIISVDGVSIKGFSIQNGSIGLYLNGKDNGGSHRHFIIDNRINNNIIGVKFDYSYYNVFTNNFIENNNQGVILGWLSRDIIIKNNNITNNEHEGILIEDASSLYIYKNNIHDNNPSAYFELETTYEPGDYWRVYYWSLKRQANSLIFSKNYYEPNRELPYPIDGKLFIWGFFNWQEDYKFDHRIYDRNPVKYPYDITEEVSIEIDDYYSRENYGQSIEIPIQIYGPNGIESYSKIFTVAQKYELDTFVNTFKQELDNAETLEEAIAIFNDAFVTLDKIGLIPKDVSVIKLQNEITGNVQLSYKNLIYKQINKNQDREKYRNSKCLIVGESTWTYRGRLIPFDNWFSIVHGAFDNLCGGIFYPAAGWIYTKGANGEWSYNGKFYGTLDVIITPGFNEHYVGATGFIGIFLGSFYIGFAARVCIETV